MTIRRFIADFWRTRVLRTRLSMVECSKRVNEQTSRPLSFGLAKAARPIFGHQSGSTIRLSDRWLGVFHGLVRLRGDLHEGNGFTTVNCVVGLAPSQLIATGWLIGCIAWALSLMGRSLVWFYSEGRLEAMDMVMAALGMTAFSAIVIGLVAYLRRRSRRVGDELFESLKKMLDAEEMP